MAVSVGVEICIFLVLVIVICLVSILLIPMSWRQTDYFPPYALSDAIYNDAVKNKHPARNLDIAVCHKNIAIAASIFKKCGIDKWWLSEGSALGLKRGGELMLHDDDVDMFVDSRHFKTFLSIAFFKMKEAGFRYVLNDPELMMLCFIRKGEKVDVSFYFEDALKLSSGFISGRDMKPFIENFEIVSVGETKVLIPSDDNYYRALYGESWKTPKIGRKNHSNYGNQIEKKI